MNYLSKGKRIGIPKTGNKDIGIEFVIEKCAMLIMKSGKWLMTERIEKSEGRRKGKSEILGNIGSRDAKNETK